MKKKALLIRKKDFNRLEKWESRQDPFGDGEKNLRLVGEWVDFFLSRHPRRPEPPDVRGIQIMHRRLSVLS